MPTDRIPLSERLERIDGIDRGERANRAEVKKMAYMPITLYLGGFPVALDRLMALLNLSPPEAKTLNYLDITRLIARAKKDRPRAEEAVNILALPFQRCYQERLKKLEGKEKKHG